MSSEELKKILLAGLIPGVIIAVISLLNEFFNGRSIWFKIVIVLIEYTVSIFIICICKWIYNGWLRAKFDLWRIGRIKGLWQDHGLIKQIQHCFSESQIIKIKVTRAYELLKSNNNYGFVQILDNLKDGKGKKYDGAVEMQFLLMLPCFKEEHVKIRYERHQTMTEDEFLETWYEFLKKIRTYNSDNLSINVRFYFENNAKWRFYIFTKPNGKGTNVLLSEYERDEPGSSEPMYKIIKGEKNIGAFMTEYFDEMWSTALTPLDLYQYINSGKCKNGFCIHCEKNAAESCKACNLRQCVHEDSCKELIKTYRGDLYSFNAR